MEEMLNGSPSAITQFTQKFANEDPKKKKKSKKVGVDNSQRDSFGNIDGIERKASQKAVEWEEDYASTVDDWRCPGAIDW